MLFIIVIISSSVVVGSISIMLVGRLGIHLRLDLSDPGAALQLTPISMIRIIMTCLQLLLHCMYVCMYVM